MLSDAQGSYEKILHEAGALLTGHFVLRAGDHSSVYVNKDALYRYPRKIVSLCKALAGMFERARADVVIGPEKGAIVLAHQVALQLGLIQGKDVLSAYAEKSPDGGFVIKRGFDGVIKDRAVLIVEDIITTGGTVEQVIEAVRDCGGRPQYVAALVNRGNVTRREFSGVKIFHSAIQVEAISWSASECPLCAKGVSVNTEIGHGRAFLAKLGRK